MDPVLDRITFEAKPAPLATIPWPEGLAPSKPAKLAGSLPAADVLVVTWTAAEAQALADVLTPGHPSHAWAPYTTDWGYFEKHLTGRSPARYSKCAAVWAQTTIAGVSVALVKSDLHLATDDDTLPVKVLWRQLLATVKPSLVVTTGTAGGIGAETVLGDVAVTNGARFNCRDAFKDAPFAHASYQGPAWTPGLNLGVAEANLLPVNAGRLAPIATRPPRIRTAIGAPGVETVDYFGFADTDDSYGIVADDPSALTEEMDDATLPLALEGSSVPWLSIRNASDPQVPSSLGDLEAQKRWAAGIYAKYGYWTTVGSAIACWAVIADLKG